MLEATPSSSLGRCPTCGQLVTLPAGAGEQRVACPKCKHQAHAGAFQVAEAPLPVLLMPEARASSHARAEVADDQERTHLLLDLPYDEEVDDAKTIALDLGAAPLAMPARRARPSKQAAEDQERTHLLLGTADVQEDDEDELTPASQRAPRAPAAAHAAVHGEEPTRLALGPLSVRAEPQTFPGKLIARLGRLVPPLLRASVWLEEALHERWPWALGALAIVCGMLAPLLDYLASGSTLGVCTWLSVVLGLGVLALAQLNGLRTDAGSWDPRVLYTRARAALLLCIESLERWPRSPLHLRLALAAQVLGWVGVSGLLWAGFLCWMRLILELPSSQSALPYLSGVLLLAGVALSWRGRQVAPAPAVFLQDFGNALAAATELPAVVDLDEPLPASFEQGTTGLHECLRALSQWPARFWPDEAAYRAALERHLQRALPGARLERERWMGASRLDGVIDLLVNKMIVIGVKRGFEAATAERAIGQMTRYARAWSGKPILLVIFDAPRDALLEGPSARALGDAREKFSLLTLRMPTL